MSVEAVRADTVPAGEGAHGHAAAECQINSRPFPMPTKPCRSHRAWSFASPQIHAAVGPLFG